MSVTDGDGVTIRTTLESVERQTGKRPVALDGPPVPSELEYLWRWFLDIHAGRTINGMGVSRATHLDLMAWQWNTGNRLEAWEVKAVNSLGNLYLNVHTEPKPEPKKKKRNG